MRVDPHSVARGYDFAQHIAATARAARTSATLSLDTAAGDLTLLAATLRRRGLTCDHGEVPVPTLLIATAQHQIITVMITDHGTSWWAGITDSAGTRTLSGPTPGAAVLRALATAHQPAAAAPIAA